MFVRTRVVCSTAVMLAIVGTSAWAQTPPDPAQGHAQHMQSDTAKWMFMQDAVVYGLFNYQGGPRGGTDAFIAPNWWMGMASKKIGKQNLAFHAMFSLDPATVGRQGYREIFQVGETFDGAPLIDHQHPHDLFMQLAAVWRVPVGERTSFTLAGAPSGEPALGPVAFMHRPSAAGLPFAPLGHHTLDATHISFGVVTAAVDHGRWTVEGSLFNGHEPDDHRWDFDFAKMNSYSGRLWFRPNTDWELQVSTGHLSDPEALGHGDIQRTTASASWFRPQGAVVRAVTVGYGINVTEEVSRQAVFGEATYGFGRTSIFGRLEIVQVETALLETGAVPTTPEEEARRNAVGAFTIGLEREFWAGRRMTAAIGAAVTTYAVPSPLRSTHGAHPASVQVFVRIQPAGPTINRMWNMRMTR